jgi:hypothetical protein
VPDRAQIAASWAGRDARAVEESLDDVREDVAATKRIIVQRSHVSSPSADQSIPKQRDRKDQHGQGLGGAPDAPPLCSQTRLLRRLNEGQQTSYSVHKNCCVEWLRYEGDALMPGFCVMVGCNEGERHAPRDWGGVKSVTRDEGRSRLASLAVSSEHLTPKLCPICRIPMQAERIEGGLKHTCERCGLTITVVPSRPKHQRALAAPLSGATIRRRQRPRLSGLCAISGLSRARRKQDKRLANFLAEVVRQIAKDAADHVTKAPPM